MESPTMLVKEPVWNDKAEDTESQQSMGTEQFQ